MGTYLVGQLCRRATNQTQLQERLKQEMMWFTKWYPTNLAIGYQSTCVGVCVYLCVHMYICLRVNLSIKYRSKNVINTNAIFIYIHMHTNDTFHIQRICFQDKHGLYLTSPAFNALHICSILQHENKQLEEFPNKTTNQQQEFLSSLNPIMMHGVSHCLDLFTMNCIIIVVFWLLLPFLLS